MAVVSPLITVGTGVKEKMSEGKVERALFGGVFWSFSYKKGAKRGKLPPITRCGQMSLIERLLENLSPHLKTLV